ncbi:aminotransferase class V-fold PLP-dependent enzyme [Agromyces kandeliae]|uniref:aminotransferase class V-fold PLP-dependent enzyme n=1 Tax=Agromyces kandeliae TaxID=2666141 RepID=UPI0012B10CB8|nr:aminotransferase class V-fold PLP-dependent enzyme [Agromyces kandeliae]
MASRDRVQDIREARGLFPATEDSAYLNTAAVGLASRRLATASEQYLADWVASGLDFVRGESAGENARAAAAGLIGADPTEVALIASVSAAAGLVAAQLGSEDPAGGSVVIGEREFSSNHFPWRMLAHRGYEVRQVPFRNGGLDPADVAAHVDRRTRLIAVSAVQTASGHRTEIPAVGELARSVGALLFVDGAQWVGALPVAQDLEWIDVLATPDHKFLLNAGRGMGYCYVAPRARERLTPVAPGWKAGATPFESYFGPDMHLSTTASRFDQSISWFAAVGDEAALSVFDAFGADAVYARNVELSNLLRAALGEIGWAPVDLPDANRSTIVSVPFGERDPRELLGRLKERRIIGAARDGNLRLSIHFYNHEDDVARLVEALREL